MSMENNPLSLLSYDEFKVLCSLRDIKRSKMRYAYDLLTSELPTNRLAKKYNVAPYTIYQDRWRYKKDC
jgi:hypothetical protein